MASKDAKTFTITIDSESDVPLWVQISQRIRHLITTGYYLPGEQLPSVRALAQELSVNYNTINKAYLSLVAEGYLESVRGRGVFVRENAFLGREDQLLEISTILQDTVDACRQLGLSLDDIQICMNRKIRQLKIEAGEETDGPAGHMVRIDPRGATFNTGTGA